MSYLAALAHAEDACPDCTTVRGRWCCTKASCNTEIDAHATLAMNSEAAQATTARHRADALVDIAYERRRQVEVESFTAERDDLYRRAELAGAAACYALAAARPTAPQVKREIEHAIAEVWPWDKHWWKPTTPRRDLVKAAALIVAEIERIDRAEARAKEEGGE